MASAFAYFSANVSTCDWACRVASVSPSVSAFVSVSMSVLSTTTTEYLACQLSFPLLPLLIHRPVFHQVSRPTPPLLLLPPSHRPVCCQVSQPQPLLASYPSSRPMKRASTLLSSRIGHCAIVSVSANCRGRRLLQSVRQRFVQCIFFYIDEFVAKCCGSASSSVSVSFEHCVILYIAHCVKKCLGQRPWYLYQLACRAVRQSPLCPLC